VITDGGLYCFLLDSPKRRDLERDSRYALHSFPPEASDDEAFLSGHARPVSDHTTVHLLAQRMRAEPRVNWRLYEFTIDVAMVVRRSATPTEGAGGEATARQVWRDPASRRRRGGGTGR
jgi:hypothetical protein